MKSTKQMREWTWIQCWLLFFHQSNCVCNYIWNSWVLVSRFTDFNQVIHVLSFLLSNSCYLVLLLFKLFLLFFLLSLFRWFLSFASLNSIGNNIILQFTKSFFLFFFFFLLLELFELFILSFSFFPFFFNLLSSFFEILNWFLF